MTLSQVIAPLLLASIFVKAIGPYYIDLSNPGNNVVILADFGGMEIRQGERIVNISKVSAIVGSLPEGLNRVHIADADRKNEKWPPPLLERAKPGERVLISMFKTGDKYFIPNRRTCLYRAGEGDVRFVIVGADERAWREYVSFFSKLNTVKDETAKKHLIESGLKSEDARIRVEILQYLSASKWTDGEGAAIARQLRDRYVLNDKTPLDVRLRVDRIISEKDESWKIRDEAWSACEERKKFLLNGMAKGDTADFMLAIMGVDDWRNTGMEQALAILADKNLKDEAKVGVMRAMGTIIASERWKQIQEKMKDVMFLALLEEVKREGFKRYTGISCLHMIIGATGNKYVAGAKLEEAIRHVLTTERREHAREAARRLWEDVERSKRLPMPRMSVEAAEQDVKDRDVRERLNRANIFFASYSNSRLIVSGASDLTPLKELSLVELGAYHANILNVEALKGMPLEYLDISQTGVRDLSPLAGMHLKDLQFYGTWIKDIRVLKGMPLTRLLMSGTVVEDLSPLKGMSLSEISFPPDRIIEGIDCIRSMKSLKYINDLPAKAFWEQYDAGYVTKRPKSISSEQILKDNKPWEGPFRSEIYGGLEEYHGTVVYKGGVPWSGCVTRSAAGTDPWRLDFHQDGKLVATKTLREYDDMMKAMAP